MRSLAAFLRAEWPDREGRCDGCRHYCVDRAEIEADLPGLAVLSSAYAAIRARDGLCRRHDRLSNGRTRCSDFERVG